MKKILIVMIFITFLSNISYGQVVNKDEYSEARALVIKANDPTEKNGERIQLVKLKILEGKYENKIVKVKHIIGEETTLVREVKKGDRVILSIDKRDKIVNIYISNYGRREYVYYISIIFILLLLVIGKKKGIKSTISLGLTILAIFKILLPAILKGYNPIFITVAMCSFITIITMFMVGGINYKSISAIIGTIVGIIIGGSIAIIVGNKGHVTGMSSESASMLMFIPQEVEFNFKYILFSGIIMGALGAIMDVGMSIASSVEEVYKANKETSHRKLFLSGMNVGKDVMGTMSNTLILAYVGSNIPLLLLLMAHGNTVPNILDLELIVVEIIRALSGSIGLIMTIPITAFAASFLICKEK
ncbi:YibE/F family protein [Anaeromicrobium sediminis]|uniref:YibE/F family protein n=1 Tax=Anaeromicrobium sediminis TaxID=1478221 RepID=A0A267MNY3_9FIRM|nr:YibE/F family protein [Anaeromicrobium sediminis]PAB60450.1 hypothetical protein CCE28_06020 [Anaeromicrobium sediminis]